MNSIKGYFQALKDVTWPKSKNVMKFFGVTLFVIVLFIFIDTLLFQELIVTKNEITKRWLIGHIEIKCSDLKVSLSKRLFTGKIMFIDTSKIFLHSRLMIIETFLFSNDDLKKLKKN